MRDRRGIPCSNPSHDLARIEGGISAVTAGVYIGDTPPDRLIRRELPQDVREDPAVAVVVRLDRGVDADDHREALGFAVVAANVERGFLPRAQLPLDAGQ